MKTPAIAVPASDQRALGARGIFYAGGAFTDDGGRAHGQMFVEMYVPRTITHPYPVIMFHGAGQTNVNWLTTPDGRPGWADWFVSHGWVVYLAEQPARGRSAYHAEDDGERMRHSFADLKKRFLGSEGSWPQSKLHTQWPQGEEAERQFLLSQVEYLNSNKRSQERVLAAAQDLLGKTGPAVLITHSQAGPFGWLLADHFPDQVMGVVALEPSGPPFSNDLSSPKAKNFGIADLPLHYEPFAASPEEFELELLKAPSPELSDGWVMKTPRQLPRLAGKPIVIVCSQSSYHSQYDHLTSHVLTQAGVAHDFVRLEDVGLYGNGHMMMLEKNSLDIAAWVGSWIETHAEKQ
ncbi:MAG: alpha/beta fold hydrolase [Pyramidobacter sp.]|nr:alpha/beta fold hydrolase [Pyramidobacter sp.]